MVYLQDALLFLRKRKKKQHKKTSGLPERKGNIGGRKARLKKEIKKILIRNRNCPFVENCFFLIFIF